MSDSTDSEFLKKLGERIQLLRKEKGWTQKDLAYRIGMEVSNLSVIENGKSNPQVLTIARIAGALEIEPKDLLSFAFDVKQFMESPVEYIPRKHK
jgi:transcriptional regulator with XRE-family HTH domain